MTRPSQSHVSFISHCRARAYTDDTGKLFICFRNKDGSWSKAVDFGEDMDFGICASLSPDGKYLFFSSTGGIPGNKADIYWVSAKIIETLRPNLTAGEVGVISGAFERLSGFLPCPGNSPPHWTSLRARIYTSPWWADDKIDIKRLTRTAQQKTKILLSRNPGGLEKGHFTGEIPYSLRFGILRCRLHTVEVRGSNPLSPTTLLSTTCAITRPGKTASRARVGAHREETRYLA